MKLTVDISEHSLHSVDVYHKRSAIERQRQMIPFVLIDLKHNKSSCNYWTIWNYLAIW